MLTMPWAAAGNARISIGSRHLEPCGVSGFARGRCSRMAACFGMQMVLTPAWSRMYNAKAFPMRTPKTKSTKKAVPLSQRVEAHLREAIHAGKLRPRQRIIEEDLAAELNVSRGPVREALLRLERDGLVVTTSRRGTFIRDISMAEIGVIFRMRAKLESLCVRYMRENSAIRHDETLRSSLKKLKAATAKNSEEEFFLADMELHRTIWKAAHQPLLYRTLNTMMNPYIFMIARVYSSRLPLTTRRDSHERYVRAVLTTPVARVEQEVERHFEELYYSTFFHPTSAFPSFGSDHWTHGNPEHPF
jgi:DNA-binding GntR family transcriptional regulator